MLKAIKRRKRFSTIEPSWRSPLILGPQRKKDADYLNACRAKRNLVEYDRVGGVTDQDADELIGFVREFKEEVLSWLKENHSSLA